MIALSLYKTSFDIYTLLVYSRRETIRPSGYCMLKFVEFLAGGYVPASSLKQISYNYM